jgi:hypothetical protein
MMTSWHYCAIMTPKTILLETVTAEIEAFVDAAGWDAGPTLFALVPTRALAADPNAAAVLGGPNADISPDAITPIAQEELPEGPLDEALAQIGWPEEVIGCALSQHILMLPPSAEAGLSKAELTPTAAAEHPERREARLVVAVLRDQTSATILRLRSTDGTSHDLLTGSDLAPNLLAALSATLID